MKAAFVCLALTALFTYLCWALVIPNLGLVLMMVPVTMVIVGAYDIQKALRARAVRSAATRHAPQAHGLRMA